VVEIEYVPPSRHLLNVLDPVRNGSASSNNQGPTPVDELVAVSTILFPVNDMFINE